MIQFWKANNAQPQQWQAQQRRWPGWAKAALVLAVVAIGGWLLFGRGGSGKDHAKMQAPIAVAKAVKKDVPVYLDGLGTVQAYNTVTVHSQVDGQLMEVLFREGQDVHAGDVLAKIDPRTFQAQYDQTVAGKAKDEATLENAKRDLDRYIHLGSSVSAQVLDTQRATVRQLEATVKGDQALIDNAATQLSYTTIKSLIDGRTGIRQVDAGNIIHAGDANGLVVITQMRPISVLFSLPQQYLQSINEQIAKQAALEVLTVGSDGHTPLDTGKLELIDNQIDQTTGTIRLKATFPNEKLSLWPGGFTNVRMLLTTRKDAIVVPAVAVQRGPQNASYVFIYKPDDSTVEMRSVKVAMTADQESTIDEGVAEGEQVVIDGMAKLQNGSKVALAGDKKEGDGAAATGAETDKNPAEPKTDASPKEHKKHGHKPDQAG